MDFSNKRQQLLNVSTGNQVYDTLHKQAQAENQCSRHNCSGSLMTPRKSGTKPRSRDEMLSLAKAFMDEYYQSIQRYNSDQHRLRWEQVMMEVEDQGTYTLTQTELVYGAKLAWRNAPRCIGRIQWRNLEVFDARHVRTARGMFEAICNHIKYGTNKGNIRSAMTIFPQRTDGNHDFRVWNHQLISYAGYRQDDASIIGDPANVEITEVCQKLGWKGKGGRFDVLPLVLSADGHDPEWFNIPQDLILVVPIVHPEYKWFKELGLQWYALPAVSAMMFDCGGLQFPAAPFSGWYMVTEIGTRDFCDPHRFNMLETVGDRMGLDTRSPVNLWKDKTLVEVNIAVLYSFQLKNVTIVDHHSISESFIKHMENEQKLRGGCPADWVWIVPPMSGSITPVFHQEMSLYYLKPSFEYQDSAWKTHVWKKSQDSNRKALGKVKRRFHFKEIAIAVMFCCKLFGKALSRRIKATILYATETGKSETYAKKLGEIFGHTFNAQVTCMDDYDLTNIEHEALVLVVTSTFGNGDAPENGKKFAKNLRTLKVSRTATDIDDITSRATLYDRKLLGSGMLHSIQQRSRRILQDLYFRLQCNHSMTNMDRMVELIKVTEHNQENNLASCQIQGSATSDRISEDKVGPLCNVRFAVFALGSSAYDNFCAFGKNVDILLDEHGCERLMKVACSDELIGHDLTFKQWAADIFRVSCKTFCPDDEMAAVKEANATLKTEALTTANKIKLMPSPKSDSITDGLARAHGKRPHSCQVLVSRNLHEDKASRWTHQVILSTKDVYELRYQPGDHVAIFPANRKSLVEAILQRLSNCPEPDEPIQVLLQKETHSLNDVAEIWEAHERLPIASMRELLTRYLDITTPPTSNFLRMLAEFAYDNEQRTRLDQLATDPHEYEEWKRLRCPHLGEVLEEFPSVSLDAGLLVIHLPLLGTRFYSISSSPDTHPGQVHLTFAVVQYYTENGKGPQHFGVCSNFLKELSPGEYVELFVRRAPSFHMPKNPTVPVILVGAGTGVAPFRGFWHHRHFMIKQRKEKAGTMMLFYGCRTKALDLYVEEKEMMLYSGALTQTHLALSRELNLSKKYVQDLLMENGKEIYRLIVREKGHFYVCGGAPMAKSVYKKLKSIIQDHGHLLDKEAENFLLQMRDEERYHEDIFDIAFRETH